MTQNNYGLQLLNENCCQRYTWQQGYLYYTFVWRIENVLKRYLGLPNWRVSEYIEITLAYVLRLYLVFMTMKTLNNCDFNRAEQIYIRICRLSYET